jgi:hypothetical protein
MVRMDSLTAPAGSVATVRLEATDVPAPGLGAATIDVTYDPSIVSPTSCTKDPSGLLDMALCNLAYQPNVVRFSGVRTTAGAMGTIPLADIGFEVVGTASQCGDLHVVVVTFADPDGNAMTATGADGQICVAAEGTSTFDDLGTFDHFVSLDGGHDLSVPGWLAWWLQLSLRLLSKLGAGLITGIT